MVEDCEIGKLYAWTTKNSPAGERTILECRARRDGKPGFAWGIPGNPNQSNTTAMVTLGWVFLGEST